MERRDGSAEEETVGFRDAADVERDDGARLEDEDEDEGSKAATFLGNRAKVSPGGAKTFSDGRPREPEPQPPLERSEPS